MPSIALPEKIRALAAARKDTERVKSVLSLIVDQASSANPVGLVDLQSAKIAFLYMPGSSARKRLVSN